MKVPNRIIGIPASKIEAHIGANHHYLEFARQFGIPRIIMPDEEFVEVDMLILPGGLDLNPSTYGEVPGFKTSNTDVFKQFFFDKRLETYVNSETPIFGICLGFQQLAAYFGCKLTQHLKWHRNSAGREVKGHEVDIEQDMVRGTRIFKPRESKTSKKLEYTLDVNSHHHQALLAADISEELSVLATAECEDWDDQRIVEAFIHTNLPIAAVQWHPEEWYDEYSHNLITKVLLNER